MFNGDKQIIESGSHNIQAGRDVNISTNYYSGYCPAKIVFYENDICDVINEFDQYTELFASDSRDNTENTEFEFIFKSEKNELNNLSEEYFEIICDSFLEYFEKIKNFLGLPQNKEILKKYRKSALQLKIHIGVIRKRFEYFEDVLNHVTYEIVDNTSYEKIKSNPDLVILFINFMYWNCDIGRKV